MGAIVEHREEMVYVTVFSDTGFAVWMCHPDSGTRTIVEHVEL